MSSNSSVKHLINEKGGDHLLSRLVPPVSLQDKTFTGKITKEMDTPSPGDPMKVFISEIMTKISSGEPTLKTVQVKGPTIFINDPACKPILKTTLKSQNYLTVSCAKNTNWDGIDKITKDGAGRIIRRRLKNNTELNISFLGALLTHGIVETRRDITYGENNTSNIYSGDMNHVHVSDPEQIGVLSDHVDNLISHLQDSKILG